MREARKTASDLLDKVNSPRTPTSLVDEVLDKFSDKNLIRQSRGVSVVLLFTHTASTLSAVENLLRGRTQHLDRAALRAAS